MTSESMTWNLWTICVQLAVKESGHPGAKSWSPSKFYILTSPEDSRSLSPGCTHSNRAGGVGTNHGCLGRARVGPVVLQPSCEPKAASMTRALTWTQRTRSWQPGLHWLNLSWEKMWREQGEKSEQTWFSSSTCLPRGNERGKIIISPATHPQGGLAGEAPLPAGRNCRAQGGGPRLWTGLDSTLV